MDKWIVVSMWESKRDSGYTIEDFNSESEAFDYSKTLDKDDLLYVAKVINIEKRNNSVKRFTRKWSDLSHKVKIETMLACVDDVNSYIDNLSIEDVELLLGVDTDAADHSRPMYEEKLRSKLKEAYKDKE